MKTPAAATPAQPSRDQYKATWTALSVTEEQARIHVIGSVGEEQIASSAEVTVQILKNTVGINPADVILEIGCGIGRVGQSLASKCARWIGCDVSSHMLKHARERLANIDNIELVEISGYDLSPISDKSVDLVYCTVVFMHLDEFDRYNYVIEAFRVLRPGGRIFVDNINLRSDEGWDVFELHRKGFPSPRPAHISRPSTPQELEVYLSRAGFDEVRVLEDKTWVRAFGIKPERLPVS